MSTGLWMHSAVYNWKT